MVQENGDNKENHDFTREVGEKERRRVRAREKGVQSAWFGLGMFGVVGWAVAVPTIVLTFIGIWLDKHVESPYSFTLMLLVAGLCLGCVNAWFWVNRQRRDIEREREDHGA